MYINESWLAGFLEGDGCFSTQKSNGRYYYPKIEIHQKNLEPLEAIRDKFGMNLYNSIVSRVHCSGSRAEKIFSYVAPYLSSKRIEQAAARGLIYSGPRAEHNLSWFAGYYEAEGCIHTKTNGQVRKDGTKKLFVAMTISQYYSDETSQFCKSALGFGRVAGPHMARGERVAYSFNLSGVNAVKTVESIKHMLSEEKHRQLEKVLNDIL